MSGLHTLVDGLAFVPTSPDSSSPTGPASNSSTTSAGTFGASHGSIFNNPNASSTSSSTRLQSFGSRRISYGSSNSLNATSHRATGSEGGVTKEVDDPSPQGSDRDRSEKDRNKKNKHITPTKVFLSPASPGRPSRAGSYRGRYSTAFLIIYLLTDIVNSKDLIRSNWRNSSTLEDFWRGHAAT